MPILRHEEDPALFREAIRFTAAETGFIPRLIEKDYFCSVLLEYLAESSAGLIFKGGTCLAKVHVGFYRLSEDLDFSISTPTDVTRKVRRLGAAPMKTIVADIAKQLPVFRIEESLTGFNSSTQYNAAISYTSVLGPQPETIRIEIGMREPAMTAVHRGAAKTALLDPIRSQPLVGTFQVRCLSYVESMAEKLRAALCRQEAAIRDFYDIDHAVRIAGLNVLDSELVSLLQRKLTVPGTGPVNVSPERLAELRPQLGAQLRSVLRAREFGQFDLDRAFDTVCKVARALG